jgi:hypothetical protein
VMAAAGVAVVVAGVVVGVSVAGVNVLICSKFHQCVLHTLKVV